jgi:hypothetical protein
LDGSVPPGILDRRARAAGLITAVAGSLTLDDLDLISAAAPDVVGVLGAVCQGGRSGRLNPGSGVPRKAGFHFGICSGCESLLIRGGSRNA